VCVCVCVCARAFSVKKIGKKENKRREYRGGGGGGKVDWSKPLPSDSKQRGKKGKRKKTKITVEEETDWSKLLTDA
jgi:hypothetical protein